LSPRLEGRVVRAHSNVYFVDVGEEVLECRPRGRLRYQDERVLAGDLVEVTRAGEGLGAIEAVLPRRNRLDRPPVANVDQVVVVFSLREPDLDLLLLDRFLVLIAESDLPAVLCLNKTDLAGAGESEEVLRVYRPLLGQALATSARTGSGLEELRSILAAKMSVLAGPSGAGKSSLLNALRPGLELPTGLVSRKARRGTHTTRHVALIDIGNEGFVADTPGFTHMALDRFEPAGFSWFFPDIARFAPSCRFSGCLHRSEPGCAVKEAAAGGRLDRGRYERYLVLLSEVEKSYRPW